MALSLIGTFHRIFLVVLRSIPWKPPGIRLFSGNPRLQGSSQRLPLAQLLLRSEADGHGSFVRDGRASGNDPFGSFGCLKMVYTPYK